MRRFLLLALLMSPGWTLAAEANLHPDAAELDLRRQHWSYQKLTDPAVPAVKDTT